VRRDDDLTLSIILKFGSLKFLQTSGPDQSGNVIALLCIIYIALRKFLRHLLRITKLDKEKYQSNREKNRSREYSKGNKTVPGKVTTTHTEDGYKQDT